MILRTMLLVALLVIAPAANAHSPLVATMPADGAELEVEVQKEEEAWQKERARLLESSEAGASRLAAAVQAELDEACLIVKS